MKNNKKELSAIEQDLKKIGYTVDGDITNEDEIMQAEAETVENEIVPDDAAAKIGRAVIEQLTSSGELDVSSAMELLLGRYTDNSSTGLAALSAKAANDLVRLQEEGKLSYKVEEYIADPEFVELLYNMPTHAAVRIFDLQKSASDTGRSDSDAIAKVNQYGAYVEVSDLLDLTAYDQVIADSAELLGEQLGTVVEWVTRDAMCSGSNVQRSNGKTSRSELTASDKLTVDEIRKAVRTLKRAKARPFNDGSRKPHFVCICSPEATYDLQSDPLWQDVSKYSNAEQIYSGEIGRLFGVVFVESTEAKIFKQSVYNAVKTSVSSSTQIALKNTPTAEELSYYSCAGAPVFINGTEYTLSSYNAATNTIILTTSATVTANDIIYSNDAGELDAATHAAMDVHATLIFGKDAYGIVDVEGSGALEIIIKPHGSSGTADPLNQRGTVGAKVTAYTAQILNDLWILRIEHAVSA